MPGTVLWPDALPTMLPMVKDGLHKALADVLMRRSRAHFAFGPFSSAIQPVAKPIPCRFRPALRPFGRLQAHSCLRSHPALPIDNNHDEQQIRTWSTGRTNWLFAGTLLAGQRAAAITSLIQSAKLNGHDPYAYLRDVLTRLPTHKACDIDQLLPHLWQPPAHTP